MPREPTRIDISDMPELRQLIEKLRKDEGPCILCRGSEDLATVVLCRPITRRKRKRIKDADDYKAFLSAGGSWSDVDTDKLVGDINESRALSTRRATKGQSRGRERPDIINVGRRVLQENSRLYDRLAQTGPNEPSK